MEKKTKKKRTDILNPLNKHLNKLSLNIVYSFLHSFN